MSRRKVAIFTGNRAEYGLQFPILRAVAAEERLEPFLLAGGAHLDPDFGQTIAEIEKDGFPVHRQVQMEMTQDTLTATAQAIGTGVLSLSRILEELRPDWLVVYGDRFESFAAMIAGSQMGIPTAHIEGGDYTEGGALDDTVRHAMTKLAHLHFTTNDHAAERVRRLGEEPWRVFVVGQPSLDLVASGEFAPPEEIVARLGLDPQRPVVLFCQHSVTTEYDQAAAQVRPSLKALQRLAAEGYQIIITYPNNDAGGRQIVEELHSVFPGSADPPPGARCARCSPRRCRSSLAPKRGSPAPACHAGGTPALPGVQIHKSLGRYRFHGVLNFIGRVGQGAFAGNSSALIKETPVFGCPAVNIGPRQQGRLRGNNVLDVPYDEQAIYQALRRCVMDKAFQEQCATCTNPYGAGNAGPHIAEVLATLPIDRRLLQKKMTY